MYLIPEGRENMRKVLYTEQRKNAKEMFLFLSNSICFCRKQKQEKGSGKPLPWKHRYDEFC